MRYILQCEDSIEGIFSAVYMAWELKYGHENTSIQLITDEDGSSMELFAEYIRLTPDAVKAEKVLRTIRRQCCPLVYERLFHAACADAEDKADVIYRYIQQALKMGNAVLNHLTDAAVVRVMELSRAVGNERHHYVGFLRFIEIPGNILLGRYEPKGRLTELIMPHFADRFPEEKFIIWDVRRNVAGFHIPHKEYIMVSLTEQDKQHLLEYSEENLDAESLWKTFVESISIKERENEKLQRNNLPLHFRTFMPEFVRGERTDGRSDKSPNF